MTRMRQCAPARLPRNVWILGFVSLLMDLSSEIYHALLPLFITVTLGLPVAALGAIDGIAEATAVVRQARLGPAERPQPAAQAVDPRRLRARGSVEAAVPAGVGRGWR